MERSTADKKKKSPVQSLCRVQSRQSLMMVRLEVLLQNESFFYILLASKSVICEDCCTVACNLFKSYFFVVRIIITVTVLKY